MASSMPSVAKALEDRPGANLDIRAIILRH